MNVEQMPSLFKRAALTVLFVTGACADTSSHGAGNDDAAVRKAADSVLTAAASRVRDDVARAERGLLDDADTIMTVTFGGQPSSASGTGANRASDSITTEQRVIRLLAHDSIYHRTADSLMAILYQVKTQSARLQAALDSARAAVAELYVQIQIRDDLLRQMQQRADSLALENRGLHDSTTVLLGTLYADSAHRHDDSTTIDSLQHTLLTRDSARQRTVAAAGSVRISSREQMGWQATVVFLASGSEASRVVFTSDGFVDTVRIPYAGMRLNELRDTIIPLPVRGRRWMAVGRPDIRGMDDRFYTLDESRSVLVIHDPARFWQSSSYLVLFPR